MMKLLLLLVGLSVALTQVPAHGQPTARASTDSLRIPILPPQHYDFYYSARQATAFTKTSIASYALEDRASKNRFRAKPFTVFVVKGLLVQESFDDYVLIGSGTIDEIKPDGYW